jgi:hypothetical protein
MPTTALVSVRLHASRRSVEITLHRGFTKADLDAVRDLPGRKYDERRRLWTAPGGDEVLTTLVARLGAGRVRVAGGPDVARARRPVPGSTDRLRWARRRADAEVGGREAAVLAAAAGRLARTDT